MKKIILIAPLLLVLATAFSAWTDEAHHNETSKAAAATETISEKNTAGENMPGHMRHMEGMGGTGMMGMMRMMAGGMEMEKMPADCQAMMGEKMAMMQEMK